MNGKNKIRPATFFNSRATATVSVSLVLFLLGLVALILLFANNLSSYIKENLSFDIVLNENASESQTNVLIKQIEEKDYVRSTVYISKDQAAKQLEKELGENFEEFLGYNPLPALIEVRLKSEYANNDSIAGIEKDLKEFSPAIKNIQYRKELIQQVNENIKKISIGILGLAILLLFISYALISNTIRLTVYSKRFLIHTMKLVGASPGFIRKPFIVSNIISGIIAALIAIGLLSWLLYYLSLNFVNFSNFLDIYTLVIVFSTVLVLGILISVAATYFSVNKYLRMKEKEMYYI